MSPYQKHGLLAMRLQLDPIGLIVAIDHIQLKPAEGTIISYTAQQIGANDPYEIKVHFAADPLRKEVEVIAIQIDEIYLEAGQLQRVEVEVLRHNQKLWKRIENGRGVRWRVPQTLKELQGA